MSRQIILDTETTGLRVEDGHRIIEVGCIELINRKFTNRHFHYYINPEREIDPGAQAVHGISSEFLKDKPLFSAIAKDFIEFVKDAELIIHNATFDVGFLNYELSLTRMGFKMLSHYCRITDTLAEARRLHPGQRNSLDALCKRYSVDNSRRDLHGALLDANLLAQVYLTMTGGQASFLDSLNTSTSSEMNLQAEAEARLNVQNLAIIKATMEEINEHEKYLQLLQKQGKCVWLKTEELA